MKGHRCESCGIVGCRDMWPVKRILRDGFAAAAAADAHVRGDGREGCPKCADERKRRYALGRVIGLDRRIESRVAACGSQEIPLACHCGPLIGVERCRQHWFCEVCQQLRAEKLRRKIGDGLRAALRDEIDRWADAGARGARPHIRLLTLTTRHSGDLHADRTHIERKWRALYQAMHREWGRFPYVGVWEVTPGSDGAGHVHAHVAVIWGYRSYDRVHELYDEPGRDHLDIAAPRRDGRQTNGSGAAKYLAKYMSKGVQGDAFTPALRAEVAVAFYNAHSVFASTRFWKPEVNRCKCCRYPVRRVIALDPATFDSWSANGAAMYYVTRRGIAVAPEPRELTFAESMRLPHGHVLVL